MSSDRFAAIEVGDEAEIEHTISQKDVDNFVDLTGDDNPLHVDADYAARTDFRKPVVHGMLAASFLSTVIGTKIPGEGALWFEQTLRFLSPVSIGERIRVCARVKHKSLAQRVIVLETVVFGSDGRKVIEGQAKVKMVESREEDPGSTAGGRMVSKEMKGAVIVSGASRGIGAAIASELALAGHAVIVNYRGDGERAQMVVNDILEAGGRAAAIRADVTDRMEVSAMIDEAVQQYQDLAGLVNNAGLPIPPTDLADAPWDDFQRHLDVQVKGALYLVQAALPHLLAQGDGAIVNISSVYATGAPPPKLAPYVTAKAALEAFSRSLAIEYGAKGLRVNCVSPGMTHTDLIADLPDKVRMVTKMQTPLRRLADPRDIAGVVAFLFGPSARHLTGQNIRVSGGSVMA